MNAPSKINRPISMRIFTWHRRHIRVERNSNNTTTKKRIYLVLMWYESMFFMVMFYTIAQPIRFIAHFIQKKLEHSVVFDRRFRWNHFLKFHEIWYHTHIVFIMISNGIILSFDSNEIYKYNSSQLSMFQIMHARSTNTKGMPDN